MKTYAYFPGCSLEKMAHSYHASALETSKALGVELQELEDWNCCGATAYFHVDELLAYTLCARNLAMAEKQKLQSLAFPDKSLYFLGGLTEATETIAAFVAMCLWPQWFGPMAYGFAALCAITTALRIGWGWQRLR